MTTQETNKEKIQWHHERRAISSLREYDKNPRIVVKEAFTHLQESVDEFGMAVPLTIQPDGLIIGGHQRYRVAIEAGEAEVDCWVPDRLLSDDEVKKLNLRLNKNVAGIFDYEMLANEYENDMLLEVGFTEIELQSHINETEEDATVNLEPPEAPISAIGDVYEMNGHRFVCMDGTTVEAMDILMKGEQVDMIFTDPPYGVNYVGKTKEKLTIVKDDLGKEGTRQLVSELLSIVPLKAGGSFYVCSPSGDMELPFRLGIQDAGLTLKQCIVWVKNSLVMGRMDYQWKHESIHYGWKEGASHYFIDDRTKTSVWTIDRPHHNKEHPTMKPVELVEEAINNSSLQGHIVYDGCAGSGSTLIACEKNGRLFHGMEIDPKYADVVVRRWVKFMKDNSRYFTVRRNGVELTDDELIKLS